MSSTVKTRAEEGSVVRGSVARRRRTAKVLVTHLGPRRP
jgi:hypothetical protein